jgi:hypothetical protein
MWEVDACRGGCSSRVISSTEEDALGEPSSTVRARGAGPARSSPEQKPPKSLLLVIGVMT